MDRHFPWDEAFCAFLDGLGVFEITGARKEGGVYHITVTFHKVGVTVTLRVKIPTSASDTDNVSVVASAPNMLKGKFKGSLSVLRTFSQELLDHILAGMKEADEADRADPVPPAAPDGGRTPVPVDASSSDSRAAAITAIGFIAPAPDAIPIASQLSRLCSESGISIVFDGTYLTVSSEGFAGGPPFNYKFGPGDWDTSLDFLRKWIPEKKVM